MTFVSVLLAVALVPWPRDVTWQSGSVPVSRPVCREDATLPREGYRLKVAEDGVTIWASSAAGRFYAEKTLEQLAEKGRYRCCAITDAPAFAWRGFHLDEARHFFGKDCVKKLIDEMSRLKFNTFHWHLTDDQGWRIEMKKYPELTQYGSVRPSSPVRGIKWQREYDGKPYGPFFYTEKDICEIVAYAAARQVTIVPEIDVPGHCQGLLAGYPWMLCEGCRLEPRAARNNWWIAQIRTLCIGNDAAIRQVEGIFDELLKLFPGEYVHFGGDECPDRFWANCPKCRARMDAEGLKNARQLQGWFSRHLADYLVSRGRKPIGWDEVLSGDPPKSCAIMSWRGSGGGVAAARNGHEAVLAPNTYCNLNRWDGNPVTNAYNTGYSLGGGAGTTLDLVYRFNPLAGVPPEAQKFVLGGQCCHWSEGTFTPAAVEYNFFPRANAIAEALWTAPSKRDYAEFRTRVEAVSARQARRGVTVADVIDTPSLTAEADWRVRLDWGCASQSFDVKPCVGGVPRLDWILRRKDGSFAYRVGARARGAAVLPKCKAGERLAGTIWITPKTKRLSKECLYPARAMRFWRPQCCWNEPFLRDGCMKTLQKLKKGEPARILFWGDEAVIKAGVRDDSSWRSRFARRVGEIYPKARVEWLQLTHEKATTHASLNDAEQIRADLVISIFPQDGVSDEKNEAKVREYAEKTIESDYEKIAATFKKNGVEWIVCVPHFTLPPTMTPYHRILARFANRNKVLLAKVASYWEGLAEQGVPWPALLTDDGLPVPEALRYYDWALDDVFRNGDGWDTAEAIWR